MLYEVITVDIEAFYPPFEKVCDVLAATRPTAVNLFWALDRMKACARRHKGKTLSELKQILLAEAHEIAREDEQINRTMGAYGEPLIPAGARILTHCNAGALA